MRRISDAFARLRCDRGQSLLLFLITLPVILAFSSLVIDGAHAFGEKRRVQNAADAAALAAAQNALGTVNGACPGSAIPITSVETAAECYSKLNGGAAALVPCVDDDSTNCYTWPYEGHTQQVEVRLTISIPTFLLGAIGLDGLLDKVSARAVAAGTPLVSPPTTETIATPGTTATITAPSTVGTTTTPGTTQVTTTPVGGVVATQAFTMSRTCDSILYSGAGGGSVAALATNGGLQFSGASGKKIGSLGFDQARCPRPGGEPTGSACTSSSSSCVVARQTMTPMPMNWPVTPPALPTPTSLAPGAPYPLSWYPSKCIDLGSGSIAFVTLVHPPGIYCVSGALTVLTISGLDLTVGQAYGQGYTFFALDGGKIHVNGNPPKLSFFWPSACGPRPATRAVFTCDGRTIADYDPQTVLYATSTARSTGSCAGNAICLDGQNGTLDGDIFATKPDVAFPPSVTQTGGTVFMAGGAVSAGSGFVQSWGLIIQGNAGSYLGLTSVVGGTTTTVTTTTPATTTTTTTPGGTTTILTPGSTTTVTTPGATTGADLGLSE
jgi:hypothetical protein